MDRQHLCLKGDGPKFIGTETELRLWIKMLSELKENMHKELTKFTAWKPWTIFHSMAPCLLNMTGISRYGEWKLSLREKGNHEGLNVHGNTMRSEVYKMDREILMRSEKNKIKISSMFQFLLLKLT